MIKGRCLCGAVEFELDPKGILLFNKCYCKKCQRNSGADFVSQLQVSRNDFQWLSGKSDIRLFESSPGVSKAFCQTCGSRLPMTDVPGEIVPVPVGLLDDDPGVRPEVNMHLDSRAQWALVDEDIECLKDQGTPAFWQAFMERKQGGK